ncbi:MAG: hypothetical protein WD425_02750 [Nitrospirales bacterium]
MLKLSKLIAQRLNLLSFQSDSETKHGLNLDGRELWEAEVMSQFQELSTQPFPPLLSLNLGKNEFLTVSFSIVV